MQLLELIAPNRPAYLLCMVPPPVPQGQHTHYSKAGQIGGQACGLLCSLANLISHLSGKSVTLYKLWGLRIQACTLLCLMSTIACHVMHIHAANAVKASVHLSFHVTY